MITKYVARISYKWGSSAEIKEVEVEKETDKSVWINGRRTAKETEYATFFDSFEAAKKALISRQKHVINNVEARHARLIKDLRAIEAL